MNTELLNGIVTGLEIAAIVMLAVMMILRHQRNKQLREQEDRDREKRRDEDLSRILANDLAGGGRRSALVGPASNRLHIAVQEPAGTRDEYFSSGTDVHVGRDPGNDLVLQSRYVGRKQCILSWERGSLFLQNVNMTNPTLLVRDGKPGQVGQQKVRLNHHDLIQAGDVRLEIELPQ